MWKIILCLLLVGCGEKSVTVEEPREPKECAQLFMGHCGYSRELNCFACMYRSDKGNLMGVCQND